MRKPLLLMLCLIVVIQFTSCIVFYHKHRFIKVTELGDKQERTVYTTCKWDSLYKIPRCDNGEDGRTIIKVKEYYRLTDKVRYIGYSNSDNRNKINAWVKEYNEINKTLKSYCTLRNQKFDYVLYNNNKKDSEVVLEFGNRQRCMRKIKFTNGKPISETTDSLNVHSLNMSMLWLSNDLQ